MLYPQFVSLEAGGGCATRNKSVDLIQIKAIKAKPLMI
jgi:hypothetical protein